MKNRLITLTLLFSSFILAAQDLHSPAEIMKIMEKSDISYKLKKLEKPIPIPDRSNNLNLNIYYRKMDGNEITTLKYEPDSIANEYLNKAEKYFSENNYSSARTMYLKLLDHDPSFYQAMTYIGQTFEMEGKMDKAIEWYTKTINVNYIDYLAHWFLADAYKHNGLIDKAVDEITIAMILNRNNPRIKQSMVDIYKLKKLKTENWVFNPQIEIDSTGYEEISISFNTDWLGYALPKAVWRYEPDYKTSMSVSDQSIIILEEKECLASLIIAMDKKKSKKYPEIKALHLAIDNKMINEYILYEIILPDYPYVAYQLSEEFLNDIKEYVKQVRGIGK